MAVKEEEIEKKLAEFDSGIHLGLSFRFLSDDSRSVALLSRYEARLHRIFHRSHQAFLDLRRDIAAGLIGRPPAPAPDNQQPTTGNRQPTTGNQQPTTDNRQPTTDNQQPATGKR